jgi:hypothetical protein
MHAEQGKDQPLSMRLCSCLPYRRAGPENLSGFPLTAGQPSSRAEY